MLKSHWLKASHDSIVLSLAVRDLGISSVWFSRSVCCRRLLCCLETASQHSVLNSILSYLVGGRFTHAVKTPLRPFFLAVYSAVSSLFSMLLLGWPPVFDCFITLQTHLPVSIAPSSRVSKALIGRHRLSCPTWHGTSVYCQHSISKEPSFDYFKRPFHVFDSTCIIGACCCCPKTLSIPAQQHYISLCLAVFCHKLETFVFQQSYHPIMFQQSWHRFLVCSVFSLLCSTVVLEFWLRQR